MELKPAEQSSQVTPAEPIVRLLAEISIACGIMANLADDMRHLQRTEIAEIGEEFEAAQVGSSTMPQKRNPINFENAKSLWKIIAPRVATAFLDQISEHQRDLTNSASTRTYGETVLYAVSIAKRLSRTMKKISVDKKNVHTNLSRQMGLIAAEPLYIILAALGHPDAHEAVRNLTLQAQRENQPLEAIAMNDVALKPYIAKMSSNQRKILANPSLYTGIAAKKARSVSKRWKKNLKI
jgi:adenylosuccinate lyase